jgi:hypothetical protein
MAKINVYVPEPTPVYDQSNQQQQLQALDQIKDQLNFSFQEELKQEMQRFSWYNARYGC